MTQDSVIDWLAIMGPIGGELANLTVDLIQQRPHLRCVAGVLICQAMRHDLTTVGIQRQMQIL